MCKSLQKSIEWLHFEVEETPGAQGELIEVAVVLLEADRISRQLVYRKM